MASITGTFTAPGQVSTDLYLAPNESATVTLTATANGTYVNQLQRRVVGTTYEVIASYTADQAAVVYTNPTDSFQHYRLMHYSETNSADTWAYTLADVAGETLLGPVLNAAGTNVFEVTDAGIETPLVTATSLVGTLTGNVTGSSLDLSASSPASHPLNFEGLTLAASKNVIRGASINPTRTSGWTSFTGTVSATPNPVYMDYKELHTTGAAEVLGVGIFPFMDSGATGKSMYAVQAICEADSGASVAAASAVGDGIFPIWAKCLINEATFNGSAVAACAFLAFQANVTDVSAADTSFINMEIASGGIRSIFKIQDSASGGATFLFDFTDDLGKPCSLTNGSDLNDISATANAGWIKVRIGSTTRYIPLYAAKA